MQQRKKESLVLVPGLDLSKKEVGALYSGLEAIANLGDSKEDYETIAKKWPEMWPCEITDSSRESLAWDVHAHRLLLVYRDSLRAVWRDHNKYKTPFTLLFLLGASDTFTELNRGEMVLHNDGQQAWRSTSMLDDPKGIHLAWQVLKSNYPDAGEVHRALIYPVWSYGAFLYRWSNKFQFALYHLFRDSWRAKMCPACGRFFIADKPPQRYCGTVCSKNTHNFAALEWWRRTGSEKRRARKAKRSNQSRRKA
jgi:hypothetical protein